MRNDENQASDRLILRGTKDLKNRAEPDPEQRTGKMNGHKDGNRSNAILQIKISLEGITPAIWRRFKIENNMTFHQLHTVIQTVMGWTDSHLYSFTVNGEEYQDERSEDFEDFGNTKILPSRKTTISALKEKQKFHYTYDFGDGWEHLLVVEKILPKEEAGRYPVCLAGARNCPPEDCGGEPGYYHLIEVRKNKKHPEYKDLIKGWLGEDHDPEYFDAKHTTTSLRLRFPKKG